MQDGTTNYTDPDVEAEATYYYRVTAVDESGNEGAFSEGVSVTLDPPPDNCARLEGAWGAHARSSRTDRCW